MSTRRSFPLFEAALPILGRDGTLDGVLKDSPAAGHVRAKTGTAVVYDALNQKLHVAGKALAGYVTTRSGRRLAFAAMINQLLSPPTSIRWERSGPFWPRSPRPSTTLYRDPGGALLHDGREDTFPHMIRWFARIVLAGFCMTMAAQQTNLGSLIFGDECPESCPDDVAPNRCPVGCTACSCVGNGTPVSLGMPPDHDRFAPP